ncbi:MAG: sigma-70 family RNA polymerase sigma factor [Spirochaetia bacterium]|nr:sigma-70 family RNA polymerase sigma factor [Spirochaetia bacterium]
MFESETAEALSKNEIAISVIERLKKGDLTSINEFFEAFSEDIYNFPMRFYNFNEDEAGDFYLYAFEHLKNGKRLSVFQQKSKFTTWFFSVLRNLTIDFLRTKKEKLKTVSMTKIDDNGNVFEPLENIADERNNRSEIESNSYFQKFSNKLEDLDIQKRILFKLAYIYYLDLDIEEIKWLSEKRKVSKEIILREILELKDIVFEKASDVKFLENKLTENFQKILSLQNSIDNFFKENPHIKPNKHSWSVDYENSEIPPKIIDLIRSLIKKKKKQISLLAHQEKSLISIRAPYKNLSKMLNTSQGVLSVQLHRTIEKFDIF